MGVSIATVSRALSNSHEVSEEMKRKIQAVAREMNYRPNPFAQSLRKETPHIIGVVVPNLVAHYYAAVLDGIEDYARQKGYSVFSSNSHESNELETLAIDNFISMHVDGIIACLAQDTTDYSHFEEIHRMGIPLVFFCTHMLAQPLFASGGRWRHRSTESNATPYRRRQQAYSIPWRTQPPGHGATPQARLSGGPAPQQDTC